MADSHCRTSPCGHIAAYNTSFALSFTVFPYPYKYVDVLIVADPGCDSFLGYLLANHTRPFFSESLLLGKSFHEYFIRTHCQCQWDASDQPDIEGTLGIGEFGIEGLIGLGLAPLGASAVFNVLQPQGNNVGQPFLFNIFNEHPTETNFIAVSLSRTTDLESSAEASFTIMELDKSFAAVKDTTPVPLFPADTFRWSVLVDAINVDGVNVPLVSTVPNTPTGKFVGVMDSGTTTALFPQDVLYALYSQIPGASVGISDSQLSFTIPCNTTSIVTVIIGGLPYLDDRNATGVSGSICVGAISFGEPNDEHDVFFGDIFMRNFYSVFNFGTALETSSDDSASMQFLSLTDPHVAAADVMDVRMAQLANKTPEFYGLLPGFQPAIPGSSNPFSSYNATGAHLASAASVADVSEADASNDSTVHKYTLIIIGLVGANLLVVLILAIIGLALYIKRGRVRESRTSRYIPVRFREENPRKSGMYDEDRRNSD
ncbi:aspartic peptidase domain-containing protein [Mycena crocata]|nr:aspartic peptidase domain-containing protein [Mycena crocata]